MPHAEYNLFFTADDDAQARHLLDAVHDAVTALVCDAGTGACTREHHDHWTVRDAERFSPFHERYLLAVLQRLRDESGGDPARALVLLEAEIAAHTDGAADRFDTSRPGQPYSPR